MGEICRLRSYGDNSRRFGIACQAMPKHTERPPGIIPAETTVLSCAIWSRPIANAIPVVTQPII